MASMMGGASADLFNPQAGLGDQLQGQLTDAEEERRKRARGLAPPSPWASMTGAASADIFGARSGGMTGKGFAL